MKKLNVLILGIIAAVFMLAGCQQIDLAGNKEAMVCVPVSNISKICDQVDKGMGDVTGNVVDEMVDDSEDVMEGEDEVDEVMEEVNETIDEGMTEDTEEDAMEEETEEMIEADYKVTEGELLVANESATDPDGDPLTITYSAPLDENGQWQTQSGDAGVYVVNVTASDGINEIMKTITILVLKKANSAPTIDGVEDLNVSEGDTVTLIPTVTDPDGDAVTVSISAPVGDDGEWVTTYDDAGTYEVTVTASDGVNEAIMTITINVANVNRAPVIESLTAAQVQEGGLIKVNVAASDADNDTIDISFGEPLSADGTWQTEIGDAGEYVVEITASDGDLSDTKTISLTVNAVNQAPVIEDLADITIDEAETVTIAPTITDPDGDAVTVTISAPVGDDGEWVTTYDDAGVYNVTVTASDGVNSVSQTITVMVNNVNRGPVFS